MIERLDGLTPISPQISNGGVSDSPAASSEQINLFQKTNDGEGQQVSTDVFDFSLKLEKSEIKPVENEAKPEERTEDLPLDKIIERLNYKLNLSNRSLQFKLDERIGRNYISIIDKETKETIKEYPPEEIRNFIAQVIKLEERMASSGSNDRNGELMVDVEV